MQLRHLLASKENSSSSHSDSSSLEDYETEEKKLERMRKSVPEAKKEREDQHRN
jgi:hypothetical protein